MSDWRGLEIELELGRGPGATSTLWWRDDDAVTATPELERLLGLARLPGGAPVPLCLAVIPGRRTNRWRNSPRRSRSLRSCSTASPTATMRRRREESRARRAIGLRRRFLRELVEGRDLLRALFADQALAGAGAALEPDCEPVGATGSAGRGLSRTFDLWIPPPEAARGEPPPGQHPCRHHRLASGPGLHRRGCRDRPDRRSSGGPAGGAGAIRTSPPGILTHHLVHDDAGLEFLGRIPGVGWPAGRPCNGLPGPLSSPRLRLRTQDMIL